MDSLLGVLVKGSLGAEVVVSPQDVVLILAITCARAVTVVGNKEVISLISFVVVTVGVGAAGEVGIKVPEDGARLVLTCLLKIVELVLDVLGELQGCQCLLAGDDETVRRTAYIVLITEVVMGLNNMKVDAANRSSARRIAVVVLKRCKSGADRSGVTAVDVPSFEKGCTSARCL